jgi:hypothetical protein
LTTLIGKANFERRLIGPSAFGYTETVLDGEVA